VTIDTGISRWVPGKRLTFRKVDSRINLYKLHGSLDWEVVPSTDRDGITAPHIKSERALESRAQPWIVVGDREKLATDGPTLALLRGAEDALERTDYLVIVGYSFGDRHINSMVRDWMSSTPKRTLSILEYEWPTPGNDYGPRGSLVRAYGDEKQAANAAAPPRIRAFAGRTAEVLVEALTQLPEADPDPYIVVTTSREHGLLAVRVENRGPELFQVRVVGTAVLSPQSEVEVGRGRRVPGLKTRGFDLHVSVEEVAQNPRGAGAIPRSARSATFWSVPRNGSLKAFGELPEDAVELTIKVAGRTLIGRRAFTHSEPIDATTGEGGVGTRPKESKGKQPEANELTEGMTGIEPA
jgi:hypothetical protein